MRHFALSIAALLVQGCAADYGGRTEQGRVVVDSESKTSLVYFLRKHEYEEQVIPLLAAGSDAVSSYLARDVSAVTAQGQTIVHEAGNFVMVYFCGDQIEHLPIQILLESQSKVPNRYNLACGN